jgi:hypothetical protein
MIFNLSLHLLIHLASYVYLLFLSCFHFLFHCIFSRSRIYGQCNVRWSNVPLRPLSRRQSVRVNRSNRIQCRCVGGRWIHTFCFVLFCFVFFRFVFYVWFGLVRFYFFIFFFFFLLYFILFNCFASLPYVWSDDNAVTIVVSFLSNNFYLFIVMTVIFIQNVRPGTGAI